MNTLTKITMLYIVRHYGIEPLSGKQIFCYDYFFNSKEKAIEELRRITKEDFIHVISQAYNGVCEQYTEITECVEDMGRYHWKDSAIFSYMGTDKKTKLYEGAFPLITLP